MSNSIGLPLPSKLVPKTISFGRNDQFDVLFVILGGLPLYLPLMWYVGESSFAQSVPFDWLFWGNQLVSMPHVWATYARLNRKIIEKKVHPLYGWPAYAIILATLAYATTQGFVLYVLTAVNVWQSYHYLRQTYGVSRFFARPEGETELERKLSFWAYHAAMPVLVLGRWNMLYIFWQGKPSDAIIPVSIPFPLLAFLGVVAAAGLGAGIYAEILKFKRMPKYDCSGFLNLVTYLGIHWYGFLCMQFYYMGFLAVTLFHAIQYLAIAWRLEEKQQSSRAIQTKFLQMVPPSLSFVVFVGMLYLCGDFMQTHVFSIGDRFWPHFAATALSTISAHHYLVDTVLWNKKAGV